MVFFNFLLGLFLTVLFGHTEIEEKAETETETEMGESQTKSVGVLYLSVIEPFNTKLSTTAKGTVQHINTGRLSDWLLYSPQHI